MKIIVSFLIGNAFTQISDNYLTFARFDVVVGGTSRNFKICVFVYVILFLYLPWCSYVLIYPFVGNLHHPFWISCVNYAGQIYIVGYFSYDIYFLFLLFIKLYLILKLDSDTIINLNRKKVMIELILRAFLHTLFSIISCIISIVFLDGGW